MKKKILLFLLGSACLLLPGICRSQTQVFAAVADASVYKNSPNNNYKKDDLLVKGSTGSLTRQIFVRFDMSAYNSSNKVSKAKLRLYCWRKEIATTKTYINAYRVADNSWYDSTLTWNTRPAIGVIAGAAVINDTARYYEWDVSEYVKAMNPDSTSNTVISFALVDSVISNNTIYFYSREDSLVAPPELLIETDAQSLPATHDASVYMLDQSRNYGTADLLVKKRLAANITRHAYLKFGLADYSLSKVGNARVLLYCKAIQSAAISTTLNLYAVADTTWMQSSLNWSNKPSAGTLIASAVINAAGKYYEWNITDYLKSIDPATLSSISFVLADTLGSDNTITFTPKESSANKPQLLIEGSPTNDNVFYVDDINGNDTNSGVTVTQAWKTLDKISSTVFLPGAKILFRAGGIWTGSLQPKGSGTASAPIIIGKYGTGDNPVIDGGGLTEVGVVRLNNQSYWELNDLVITNWDAVAATRKGIEVVGHNAGVLRHIHIKGVEIRDIAGTVGDAIVDKRSAGIYIYVDDPAGAPPATRYDDILIENCYIHHCNNQGIVTEGDTNDYPGTTAWQAKAYTNLVIRNNTLHDISKNAMIIRLADKGLVEHNLCYNTATGTTGNTMFSRSSLNTIFQYNEGYLNKSTGYDGSMYDPDLESPGCIFQYSYSHDNAHGLVWFCTNAQDTGVVVRYNLSRNDRGSLVYFNFAFNEAKVYNNVFYIGDSLKPSIIRENRNNSHNYRYQNNIVYNNSDSSIYQFAVGGAGVQTRNISHNTFYGKHSAGEPTGNNNNQLDPMFILPGLATSGWGTAEGYKLQPASSAIQSGTVIPGNGGKDYFGITVSDTATPNRGLYNGKGVTAMLPEKQNFHVYPLIGQSNMAGRGDTAGYTSITHPRVLMLNKDNEWVIAKHPLHFDKPMAGVGPGLKFGMIMADMDTTVTIGLVPCAVGGTAIEAWQPGGFDAASGKYPYDDAVARINTASLQGDVKGILFHQGEANSGINPSSWPSKIKSLITNMRSEVNKQELPFILGELGYFRSTSASINTLLPQLVTDVPFTGIASADSLVHNGDTIHFNSPSADVLGERYAGQMLAQQGMTMRSVAVIKPEKHPGTREITTTQINRLQTWISIAPNPGSSFVYLNAMAMRSTLTVDIFDMSGRLMKHFKLPGGSNSRIDVADLKNGMYILRVAEAGDSKPSQSLKFIKR